MSGQLSHQPPQGASGTHRLLLSLSQNKSTSQLHDHWIQMLAALSNGDECLVPPAATVAHAVLSAASHSNKKRVGVLEGLGLEVFLLPV